jgi:hypothetical protein
MEEVVLAGEAVDVAVKVSEQLGPAKKGSVKSEEAVARCEVYSIYVHMYTFIRVYRCSHHGQVYFVRNYIYIYRERERERESARARERESF